MKCSQFKHLTYSLTAFRSLFMFSFFCPCHFHIPSRWSVFLFLEVEKNCYRYFNRILSMPFYKPLTACTMFYFVLVTRKVFQRDLSTQFQLRSIAARTVYAKITEKYPSMPFSIRDFDLKDQLGLKVGPWCLTFISVNFAVGCTEWFCFVFLKNLFVVLLLSRAAWIINFLYRMRSNTSSMAK